MESEKTDLSLISAQLGFAEIPRNFVQLHIFSGFRFSIEDYGHLDREISMWERYNSLKQETLDSEDTFGLESLFQTLKKYLVNHAQSRENTIAISIIHHSGENIATERFGYFESVTSKSGKIMGEAKILSIQLCLQDQRCPINILPNMTIKIYLNPTSEALNVSDIAIKERVDGRRSFEKARRVSQLLMESAQARAKRASITKFNYYDIPSASCPAGAIRTENPIEAKLFMQSFSMRSAPMAKKNFFVRNHRELAAGILLGVVVIILAITLHFAYFVKNADASGTVSSSSGGETALPACSSTSLFEVKMVLQLRGVSDSSFTTSMFAIIKAAMGRVLGIDWPICLVSTREVPERRISTTIDMQLNLRLLAPSSDLQQAAMSSILAPDIQANLNEDIALALESFGNISVAKIVLQGAYSANKTSPLPPPSTTQTFNDTCRTFQVPANATAYPTGVVRAGELVVVVCNGGYEPQGPGSLQSRCLPDGTFAGPIRSCAACQPGFYRPLIPVNASLSPEDARCSPCAAGHYSDTPAATSCIRCGLESFQNQSESTACTACPAFSQATATGSVDSSSCRCVAGYIGPRGGPCTACGAGMVAPYSDMTACVQCEPQTRAVVNGLCLCRPGFASTIQDPAAACTACTSGEVTWDVDHGFNTYGSATCVTCTSVAAHLDYFVPPDPGALPTCVCAAGYQLASGVACIACPAGSYSMSGGACISCPLGTFNQLSASTVCDPCPAGSMSDNGLVCLVCPVGSFSGPSSSFCSVCPFGRYSSSNSSACDACPAGKYGAGVGQCVACEGGTYSPQGSPACFDCPAGAYSNFMFSACVACAPASYTPVPHSTVCHTCAAGTYSSSHAASACSGCPAGKYSLTAASRCEICAAGTFQVNPTSSSCQLCPVNTFQPSTAATACGDCPPSSHTDGNGTQAIEGCVCDNKNFSATTAGSCSPLWRRGVQLNLPIEDLLSAGWRRCFSNPFLTPLSSMAVAMLECPADGLLLFAATRAGDNKVIPIRFDREV